MPVYMCVFRNKLVLSSAVAVGLFMISRYLYSQNVYALRVSCRGCACLCMCVHLSRNRPVLSSAVAVGLCMIGRCLCTQSGYELRISGRGCDVCVCVCASV